MLGCCAVHVRQRRLTKGTVPKRNNAVPSRDSSDVDLSNVNIFSEWRMGRAMHDFVEDAFL